MGLFDSFKNELKKSFDEAKEEMKKNLNEAKEEMKKSVSSAFGNDSITTNKPNSEQSTNRSMTSSWQAQQTPPQQQSAQGIYGTPPPQMSNGGYGAPPQQPMQQRAYGMPPQQPTPQNNGGLYGADMEKLIDLALLDGELSQTEITALFNRASSMGINLDEFQMVLQAKLYEKQQKEKQQKEAKEEAERIKAEEAREREYANKCPSCGAPRQGRLKSCPDCGFVFPITQPRSTTFAQANPQAMNQYAAAYSQAAPFHEALARCATDGQRISIIKSHPLPYDVDELIETFNMSLSNAQLHEIYDSDGDYEGKRMYDIDRAWLTRAGQAYQKVLPLVSGDEETVYTLTKAVVDAADRLCIYKEDITNIPQNAMNIYKTRKEEERRRKQEEDRIRREEQIQKMKDTFSSIGSLFKRK